MKNDAYPSKNDASQLSDVAGGAGTEPKPPASAPEIDPTLLTALQKQRIEDEFELEDDNPQQLKPSEAPEPAVAQPRPAKPGVASATSETETRVAAAEAASQSGAATKATDSPADNDATDESADDDDRPAKTPRHGHHPLRALGRHKKLITSLLLLAVIGALAGVPYTRYMLAALAVKQEYAVTVTDTGSRRPVSSAMVSLDGQQAVTDKDGKAVLRGVKPGHRQLAVSKKYYKDVDRDVLVPIYGDKGAVSLALAATGRQVPVTVTNALTGKPLEDVSLKSAGTEFKTDKDGKVSIVLPTGKPTLEIDLSAKGYNDLTTRVTVTDQAVKDNDFRLVPSGRLYFLSGQSGKIDVVKTNLDGSDRQTVVYGTGKEDDRNTVLLASRDWKYLAFYSKRDSSPAKLYLVDTSNDKLTTIDGSDAQFNLVGWSGHQFAFLTTRNGGNDWDAGRQAVKTYDADKKQLLTVDQNQAQGDQASNAFQQFANPYLVKDKLVYNVEWFSYSGADLSSRNDSIRMVAAGSQNKQDVRTFPAVQYNAFQATVYEPAGIYYAVWSVVDNKYSFFEFENGQVKDASIDQDKFFNGNYPTYLASPDGSQVFWSEQRDGRPTFFVGGQDAKDPQPVGVIDDGAVYGWYSGDYLLVSKKGSELYIMPATGGTLTKVSDYHKPQLSYRGYGGGYGGL